MSRCRPVPRCVKHQVGADAAGVHERDVRRPPLATTRGVRDDVTQRRLAFPRPPRPGDGGGDAADDPVGDRRNQRLAVRDQGRPRRRPVSSRTTILLSTAICIGRPLLELIFRSISVTRRPNDDALPTGIQASFAVGQPAVIRVVGVAADDHVDLWRPGWTSMSTIAPDMPVHVSVVPGIQSTDCAPPSWMEHEYRLDALAPQLRCRGVDGGPPHPGS